MGWAGLMTPFEWWIFVRPSVPCAPRWWWPKFASDSSLGLRNIVYYSSSLSLNFFEPLRFPSKTFCSFKSRCLPSSGTPAVPRGHLKSCWLCSSGGLWTCLMGVMRYCSSRFIEAGGGEGWGKEKKRVQWAYEKPFIESRQPPIWLKVEVWRERTEYISSQNLGNYASVERKTYATY